jgi:hypothetical protein
VARLTRIEALLGVAIPDADEAALVRLVAGEVREEQDLEYKGQLYGTADSDKKALAGDVAALANTVGGLLLLGIQESNGAAANLAPVALSDQEEVRMHQTLASLVAPHPEIRLCRIPSSTDPNRGYYLIEVPRSPLAPHAVRINNEALRYPKRDGSSIRWLAESEIADAYRSRFAMAQQQVERLSAVRREGEAALPDVGESAWLSLALVPNLTGEMPLTRKSIEAFHKFRGAVPMPPLSNSHPSLLLHADMTPRAGFRRVEVLLGTDDAGKPRDGVLHLHVDGAGFVGVRVAAERRDQRFAAVYVPDVLLTQETINAVSLLAHQAVNRCGTSGEAAIEATLLAEIPVQLADSAGPTSNDTWGHQTTTAPVGRHTVDLDEIVGSGKGLAIAARQVLNDLAQGFGIPESPQLTAEGALRIAYFPRLDQHRLRRDAPYHGLATTTDTL